MADESLFFGIVAGPDLEQSSDCIADVFGNFGTGLNRFFDWRWRWFCSLGERFCLTVFIPVKCLADYIIRASSVTIHLRRLEFLTIFDVGQPLDIGCASPEFFSDSDTFLGEFALKKI